MIKLHTEWGITDPRDADTDEPVNIFDDEGEARESQAKWGGVLRRRSVTAWEDA